MKKIGFSLIELLVVIAIAAILIAIGTASYITAQKQVRDTKRKVGLSEIRQALETYRSEHGTYPNNLTLLTPDYITSIPTDPKSGTYYYLPDGQLINYQLCATLEITPSPQIVGCASVTYNYQVINP
ncbi:MAG: prepilin-type N-terminal cleavage/methylation domain-containing protein [bacterium]